MGKNAASVTVLALTVSNSGVQAIDQVSLHQPVKSLALQCAEYNEKERVILIEDVTLKIQILRV